MRPDSVVCTLQRHYSALLSPNSATQHYSEAYFVQTVDNSEISFCIFKVFRKFVILPLR